MDFFHNQDIARRKTRYLVVLYIVAVCALICFANVVIAFCLIASNISSDSFRTMSSAPLFSWNRFGLVSLAVTSIIICAIVYKWIRIGDGGRGVAESLGGTRIHPNSTDREYRRILNVVEEMALASGMPVPPVYILAQERGINAFAAGKTPADAVIGITKGGLEQFNREQLQGVIAHEFSHILNGDMRMNLRLIALLNGLLFIGGTGQFLLRGGRFGAGISSSRRVGGGRLFLLGLAMTIIGWLGTFFGGLIKAAINRQREYLADASAVQFTRNPNGIADALKIIGGYSASSRVLCAGAGEVSHMFIGNALSSFETIFNTHPPLEKRIRKLEPRWDGKMISRKVQYRDEDKPKATIPDSKKRNIATSMVLAGALGSSIFQNGSLSPDPSITALPHGILDELKDPLSAMATIFALLLDKKAEIKKEQLKLLQLHGAHGAASLTSKISDKLVSLEPIWRIALIEKAIPALKCLSANQYKLFQNNLVLFIRADRKIELFEWCLFQLIKHYLGAEFGDKRGSQERYKYMNNVAEEFCLVLSTLVHNGEMDDEIAQKAFNRGASTAGLYNSSLLEKNKCTMKGFSESVRKLADCYPLLKSRILKGLLLSVEFDGKITAAEQEIVTSIAAVMDSPLPRLNPKVPPKIV